MTISRHRSHNARIAMLAAVLPDEIAEQQAAWERRRAMLRSVRSSQSAEGRRYGTNMKAIAAHLGIAFTRVSDNVRRAERDEGRLSPIERYFADASDIRKLAAPLRISL